MRSGKTSASRYTTGGKGIHRPVGASDAMSTKSGYSAKSGKSQYGGSEYSTKKAKGDMKKKGKLDPYAYIPLSRNTLNKRYVYSLYLNNLYYFLILRCFFFQKTSQTCRYIQKYCKWCSQRSS